MSRVSELEEAVRDLVNDPRRSHTLRRDTEGWLQLCAAMDVIGDVQEAIAAYPSVPDDASIGASYLAVYGVLNGLVIQQDAVEHLCERLGVQFDLRRSEPLSEVRKIRVAAAGHPTDVRDALRYYGIVRGTLSSRGFELYSWARDGQMSHRNVVVAELIADQEDGLSEALSTVIRALESEDDAHRERFRDQRLIETLHGADYVMEKIAEGARHADRADFRATGGVGLKLLEKMLHSFRLALDERGIETGIFESIDYAYDSLEHPLERLNAFYGAGEDGTVDPCDASAFSRLIKEPVTELTQIARELDEEYGAS